MRSPPRRPRQRDSRIVIGSREQIFHLLAEASEIEHTLMCTYLYAAFSLKTGREGRLAAADAKRVARWRKQLLAVAVEEMVHLVLVCNLSVALGGRAHLARPNFPISPGYFPSGVVVKLAAFSWDTLKHFVFLERPSDVDRQDGVGFKRKRAYTRKEGYRGVMPSAQEYRTVGHLYAALAENLKHLARRIGEKALFVGPASAQVGPAAMTLPGVRLITNLDSALEAIAAIVEQGEGSAEHRDNSHYQRFVTIQREYQEVLEARPAFQPAWPVATSPVMRKPVDPGDRLYVDHPRSARVLDFVNALYCELLRCLSQSFGRTGPDAKRAQEKFLAAAVDLMHLFATAGTYLARLPAARRGKVNAGVSFTMLRGIEPVFGGQVEQTIFQERLDELARAAQQLPSAPSLTGMARELRAIGKRLGGARR